MPTTIDIENAKQIRQPMEVYVEFDATNPEIDLHASTSGTTPKIYDYSTITEDWDLRKLADLQGDGFQLNGLCVLYDSTETASSANGKIGARGNIGDTVGIKLSPNVSVESVVVAGVADHVTFNNVDYDLTETGKAIVQLNGAQNPVLVFHASSANVRAEVQYIVYGVEMKFSNDQIIRANLNLRSDLKPIDPTLPESEIEVEVYYPDNISTALSSIADNKPLTYQAGYDNDICETRRFYISEPPSWENKILTFKAKDSVGLLDKETFPCFIGGTNNDSNHTGNYYTNSVNAFSKLNMFLLDQLYMGGIELVHQEDPFSSFDGEIAQSSQYNSNSLVKRQSQRDVIANIMNLMHWQFADYGISSGYYAYDAFWPTFVDAGIPTATWSLPSVKWDIYEADCANVVRNAERKIKSISIPSGTVSCCYEGNSISTIKNVLFNSPCTVLKNGGAIPACPDFCRSYSGKWEEDGKGYVVLSLNRNQVLPIDSGIHPYIFSSSKYGEALLDGNIEKNNELHVLTKYQDSRRTVFRSFWEWNASMASKWSELVSDDFIGADDTAANSQDSFGTQFFLVEEQKSIETNEAFGVDEIANNTSWFGVLKAGNVAQTDKKELLPDLGLKQLVKRSNITGSFTWKGDPRMQPRDFFNFHRLDGTVEVCTIENISLTHEKGGTQAEITYRKGKV